MRALRACGAVVALVLAASPTAAACERLVALAPNLVELGFALGLGERFVAVGDYVREPPEAARRPRVGGLLDPHVEQIVALGPDLVLLLPSEAEAAARLERVGIDTLVLPSETLADVTAAASAIGRRCDRVEDAERFVETWRRELAAEPRRENPPSVLVVVGRRPGSLAGTVAAGPGTFLDELLGLAGARNALAGSPVRYPQIGLEEIVGDPPDVIVELQPATLDPAARRALVADWGRLAPAVPAARSERIVVIEGDWTLVPGPRLPRLLAALRRVVAEVR